LKNEKQVPLTTRTIVFWKREWKKEGRGRKVKKGKGMIPEIKRGLPSRRRRENAFFTGGGRTKWEGFPRALDEKRTGPLPYREVAWKGREPATLVRKGEKYKNQESHVGGGLPKRGSRGWKGIY